MCTAACWDAEDASGATALHIVAATGQHELLHHLLTVVKQRPLMAVHRYRLFGEFVW